MKLTKSSNLEAAAAALRKASMQGSMAALGEESYAGAFGCLSHLVYEILKLHPQSLETVNAYIARHSLTSATAAGVPVVDQPGEESSSGVVRRAPLLKFRREAAELDEKMRLAGIQLLEECRTKPQAAASNATASAAASALPSPASPHASPLPSSERCADTAATLPTESAQSPEESASPQSAPASSSADGPAHDLPQADPSPEKACIQASGATGETPPLFPDQSSPQPSQSTQAAS